MILPIEGKGKRKINLKRKNIFLDERGYKLDGNIFIISYSLLPILTQILVLIQVIIYKNILATFMIWCKYMQQNLWEVYATFTNLTSSNYDIVSIWWLYCHNHDGLMQALLTIKLSINLSDRQQIKDFPHQQRRECRGISYAIKTERIISKNNLGYENTGKGESPYHVSNRLESPYLVSNRLVFSISNF